MSVGERVAPPRGYIDFCSREPAECPPSMRLRNVASAKGRMSNYWRVVFEALEPAALPHAGGSTDPWGQDRSGEAQADPEDATHYGPLPATQAFWRDLDEVNQSINERITGVSDQRQYGRSDYWAMPLEHNGAAGDCEDYVLEKRHALRARGYPENLLSIAMVTTSWGESHAVLLVQSDQGEVVLDSLTSRIVAWRDAPYRWESRQSPEDSAVWVSGPDHKAKRASFWSR